MVFIDKFKIRLIELTKQLHISTYAKLHFTWFVNLLRKAR